MLCVHNCTSGEIRKAGRTAIMQCFLCNSHCGGAIDRQYCISDILRSLSLSLSLSLSKSSKCPAALIIHANIKMGLHVASEPSFRGYFASATQPLSLSLSNSTKLSHSLSSFFGRFRKLALSSHRRKNSAVPCHCEQCSGKLCTSRVPILTQRGALQVT